MKKSDITFIFVGVFGAALFIAYWLSRSNLPQTPVAPTSATLQFDPLDPRQNQQVPKPQQLQPRDIAALIAELSQLNAAAADLAAQQLKNIGSPAVAPLTAARAETKDVLMLARINDVLQAIAARPPAAQANQPLIAPLNVAPPPLPEIPNQQRTTNIRTFTDDGKQYRVTQITEGDISRLTVEITNAATGQPIQRIEAANETELSRTNPQLFAILKQNENVGDREQVIQGPGRMSRVVVRGGGRGVVINLGGRGFFGGRREPIPNLPKPEAPASTPIGDFGAKLAETADGVRVIDVTPNSRAAASGLNPADLIIKINGRQINSLDDANDLIQKADPNQPLKLEVTRRGELMSLPTEP